MPGMGTRRRLATVALLVFAAAAFATGAHAEVIQSGDVRVNFLARFMPTTLPRETPAPITVEVGGKISTTDGSHPPALRNLRVELNSTGRIESTGLPGCEPSLLQSTDSTAAIARCGPAKVGDGTFQAQLRLGGKPLLVTGRALVFNATVAGRPGMLIHIYIAEPVRVTFVIPLRISHQSGEFGTVLTAHVPTVVGGLGSVTDLRLRIGRQYQYRGTRRTYLSAECAAPAGFPGAPFSFARGTFGFEGGRTGSGVRNDVVIHRVDIGQRFVVILLVLHQLNERTTTPFFQFVGACADRRVVGRVGQVIGIFVNMFGHHRHGAGFKNADEGAERFG